MSFRNDKQRFSFTKQYFSVPISLLKEGQAHTPELKLKRLAILFATVLLPLALLACQSAEESSCFEDENLRDCVYLCHQGNNQACALELPLGQKKCIEQGNMDACTQLCYTSELEGSHPPTEPFCIKIESLCRSGQFSDHEECQL
ncbi:MAG: hypothetical protein CMF59_02025 [Leptospiraceae bacterium]|nr:hypothetical protein [Leptospiraceae bacterium]